MQNPTDKCRLYLLLFSLAAMSLFMSSCDAIVIPRIVLWHSWEGEQAQVINAAVERFNTIFDDVVIVTSYVPSDELIDRYQEVAPQGLGPDIFIGRSDTLGELADAELIQPLSLDVINSATYYSSSLASLTYNDRLYGVPFAMRPSAMYYNRNLIETPAATLNELLAAAESGTGVAINTQFSQILWGLQAFGGQPINAEGQIALNQGAFTNWLNWLVAANANPEIFLSRDTTTLRQLFIDGRVAYYTGSASELTILRSTMEADTIGVAPLPSGPNGTSGPLMQVDAFMFNSASSELGHEKARDLAVFLTNLEQSTTFMRDLQIVPANRRVRVDLRTYPAIAGFIAQTRSAIAVPQLPQINRLLELGDDMLLRVLEGVVEPNVAAQDLTNQINTEFGLTTEQPIADCELSGELVLWHSLSDNPAAYLADFVSRLNSSCPDFNMTSVSVPRSEIIDTYIEALTNNDAPDLLLTSSASLQRLVNANAIRTIDRERMQSLSPISQATITLAGVPYGIPVSLNSNVFYYNTSIIPDAPVTMDELLVEGSPAFSLSRSNADMFWTLTAYNGISVQGDEILPDLDALIVWVNWLSQIDSTGHIDMTINNFLRRDQFLQGESAYYIDSNLNLSALSQQLGDNLAVAPFPTGTSAFASPLVTSLALFISPNTEYVETALGFATELTDVDEQEQMVDQLRWIPANIIADEFVTRDSTLSTIARVMQTGVVINNDPDAVSAAISRSIDRVFRGEQASDVIAQDLYDTFQQIGISE